MVWGGGGGLGGARVKFCLAPARAPLVAEREISLSRAHPAHNHSLFQSPILDQTVFIRWRTSPGAQPPKTPWWNHWILKVLLPRCFPKILRTTSRRTPFLNRKAGCFFVYIYIILYIYIHIYIYIYIYGAQPCAQYLVWGRFRDFWDVFWEPSGINSWNTLGVCTFSAHTPWRTIILGDVLATHG